MSFLSVDKSFKAPWDSIAHIDSNGKIMNVMTYKNRDNEYYMDIKFVKHLLLKNKWNLFGLLKRQIPASYYLERHSISVSFGKPIIDKYGSTIEPKEEL